jgi:hypothetical protein
MANDPGISGGNNNIVGGRQSGRRQLKRYQLQWRPNFPFKLNNTKGVRVFVIGEKLTYLGFDYDRLFYTSVMSDNESEIAPDSTSGNAVADNPDTLSLDKLVNLGTTTTLILPLNTNIALAEEYSPGIKNRIVEYETLGGNSITTFGQSIKKIGLRIKIIKAGRHWETYYKGLEAMSYLSANQSRYYGSLYLLGYDMFADGTERVVGRYKVAINSLDFSQRSSENNVVSATLEMSVIYDYGNYAAQKRRIWGAL